MNIKFLVAIVMALVSMSATADVETPTNNRNCVAIVDSVKQKLLNGVTHQETVVAAFRQAHPETRVVVWGSADSPSSFKRSLETAPCRVTSLSIFSLQVAAWIYRDRTALRDDTTYVIATGNYSSRSLSQLERVVWFGFPADSKVILAAGGAASMSIACEYMQDKVEVPCITRAESGVLSYRGAVYRGASYATPVIAGGVLQQLLNGKVF